MAVKASNTQILASLNNDENSRLYHSLHTSDVNALQNEIDN